MDIDAQGDLVRCRGVVCTPPSPEPLDASDQVLSPYPGSSLARVGLDAIYVREDAASEFRQIYGPRDTGWFGAVATRDSEVWAFHTGRGAPEVNAGPLNVVTPSVARGAEVPTGAAYDSAREAFVVVGTQTGTVTSWIRRVDRSQRVDEVPIPAGLRQESRLIKIVGVGPSLFVIATHDGRLLRLRDDAVDEIPIESWDDPSTANVEARPSVACSSVSPYPWEGEAWIFRDLAAAGGVAFAAGCEALPLRIFAQGTRPTVQRINPIGSVLEERLRTLALAMPCPGVVLSGISTGQIYEFSSPTTMSPDRLATYHGFAPRVLSRPTSSSELGLDPFAVLKGAEAWVEVRAEGMAAFVEPLGSMRPTQLDIGLRAAAVSPTGLVVLAGSGGRLIAVRTERAP